MLPLHQAIEEEINMQITPKMALAGRKKLYELGFEDADFTDAQEVFLAMLKVAPAQLHKALAVAEGKGERC